MKNMKKTGRWMELYAAFLRRLWQDGKLFYIGGSDVLPPPLSPEEEEDCISRLGLGEGTARDMLIEHNLRLVVYSAKKFENTGVGIEDLISIGTIGLMKEVNTFDAAK